MYTTLLSGSKEELPEQRNVACVSGRQITIIREDFIIVSTGEQGVCVDTNGWMDGSWLDGWINGSIDLIAHFNVITS